MTRNGFSLVGVLIAVALMGIISLGLMTIMSTTFQSQKLVQQRQSVGSTQLHVIGVLSDRTVCETNFRNLLLNAPVPRIQSNVTGTPEIVLETGVDYEQHALRVTSMALRNFRPYANAGPDLLRGTMDLTLGFEGTGTGLTRTPIIRQVLLAVELNGYPPVAAGDPQAIKTCVAVGNDFNNVWKLKPNGDIYFQAFNVGIGTMDPTQKLHVAGSVLADAYLHESDERLKEDIHRLDGVRDISKLRGVRFKWKSSGEPAIGLIAQDVEKVYPEVVTTDPQTGIKMVAYDQLVAPLIEANKALIKKVQKLESRIEQLEKAQSDR